MFYILLKYLKIYSNNLYVPFITRKPSSQFSLSSFVPEFIHEVRSVRVKYGFYGTNARNDRRWLLMFILARFPLGRILGAYFYRVRSMNKKDRIQEIDYPDLSTSIFPDLDVDLAIKSIEEDGYCLGLKLPDRTLQAILEYAAKGDIGIDGEPSLSFKYADKEQAEQKYNQAILIGNYSKVNTECLAMQQLASDPKLIAIATEYLGQKPLLVRSQMGWTFVASKEAYAQKGELGSPTVLFHYDLDDYRALKFFFYLTNVDSLSGSHRCVAGSHKKRKLLHYVFRSQSDLEIADYYGSDRVIEICGQAGTGFGEDPFCFHRGSPPVNSPRLMIQLEFALNDYGMWEM